MSDKYRVNCLTLTNEGHVRSRSFVISVDDKTAKNADTLRGTAAEECRRRFGDEARLTRVHRW